MPDSKAILVVEDETDFGDLVEFHLQKEGYAVRRLTDGNAVVAEVQRRTPDLILLDRMLPRVSGDEVATRLKRDPRTASVPLIMLTAKAEEADELVGFALGADDYVSKPVTMKLLLARISAVLRRHEAAVEPREILSVGPVTLDRSRHLATANGLPIALTATEFRVLAVLMQSRGRVLERGQVIDAVLGTGVAVTHRTIDVHVAALRKKLGALAGWIQTVRGVGYTFRAPTGAAADAPQ
ncbi:MAG: response regulator transcription factor [Phycisphaerae bacterium]